MNPMLESRSRIEDEILNNLQENREALDVLFRGTVAFLLWSRTVC